MFMTAQKQVIKVVGRCAIAVAALITIFTEPLPAFAASPPALPPDSMIITPGGVDLRSGLYKINKTVLTIGEKQVGGIDFRRINRSYLVGEVAGKLAQFNHNWDIRFRRKTRAGSSAVDIIVTSDELSYTFIDSASSGSLTLTSNTAYATMTRTNVGSSAYYTLTTADGTVVVSQTVAAGTVALATSVTKANGARYTLSYDTLGPSGMSRLRNVVSNAGYALILEYYPNSGTTYFISKACVINLAQLTLPAGNLCPLGVSTASYTYAGQVMASETDPTGAVWGFTSTFVNSQSAFTETYSLPGASTPYLTINYDYAEGFQIMVIGMTLADGQNYSYGWSLITAGDGSNLAIVPFGYSESAGIVSVGIDVYRPNVFAPPRVAPGLSHITDALNRTTTFDWCLQTCAYVLLRSKTTPEGFKAEYHNTTYHNIDQVTYTPKPGSPLAQIVTSSDYDCSTMINCNKPTYTIDGNGNREDFTYDPTHGGTLTDTMPAVGGIRPQTRYAYMQRYAWLSNGGGGYVQAASPIWLLSEERSCRTTATVGNACAGGSADEVVTAYDYGPNSGPNNLLLRGVAVTADGQTLRTCYGYDANGWRVSETKPRAGLTSCP